jgi:hypothetical protein
MSVKRVDEAIAALPGLEGLTLVRDYVEQAKRRAAERPGWAGRSPDAGAR